MRNVGFVLVVRVRDVALRRAGVFGPSPSGQGVDQLLRHDEARLRLIDECLLLRLVERCGVERCAVLVLVRKYITSVRRVASLVRGRRDD